MRTRNASDVKPHRRETEDTTTVDREPTHTPPAEAPSFDPTQGRQKGSRPYDDPTQGRRLGSDPSESQVG